MKPLPPVTRTTMSRAVESPLKLSVCIITYNRARYLRGALKRLLVERPLDLDFEVLISDNDSSDDTEKVVATFSEQDPRIRYYRQTQNVGAEANMIDAGDLHDVIDVINELRNRQGR